MGWNISAVRLELKLLCCFQIVEALVRGGSDVNLRDTPAGNTPLHHAILNHRIDAASILIESG